MRLENQATILTIKLVVIGILGLALWVPTSIVGMLVHERADRRDEVVREVSATWGEAQVIEGPVLSVPINTWEVDEDGDEMMDPSTGRPLHALNEKDPGYQRKLSRRKKAVTVALFLECLGDQVKPGCTLDDHDDDPVAYFLDGVWGELEEAGLDVGVFCALNDAALELTTGLNDFDVAEARADLGIEPRKKGEGK